MMVTLVGSKGLIGSALKMKLDVVSQITNCLDFEWQKMDSYLKGQINFSDFMLDFDRANKLQLLSISDHIIICLGVAHVSSSQSEVVNELRILKQIINDIWFYMNQDSNILLISSGGGIFNSSRKTRYETDSDYCKTPYALMKLDLEDYFKNASKISNKFVIRLPNIYGEQQNPNKKQGLLFKISQAHITNSELRLTRNVLSQKQYILNSDIADGMSKFILELSSCSTKTENLIHLVQSDSVFSIQNLIAISENVWQKPLIVRSESSLPYDTVILGTKYPKKILSRSQNTPEHYFEKIREKNG